MSPKLGGQFVCNHVRPYRLVVRERAPLERHRALLTDVHGPALQHGALTNIHAVVVFLLLSPSGRRKDLLLWCCQYLWYCHSYVFFLEGIEAFHVKSFVGAHEDQRVPHCIFPWHHRAASSCRPTDASTRALSNRLGESFQYSCYSCECRDSCDYCGFQCSCGLR